jgi:mRNA-degrading endonuclease RelE of RelBE toxin-antitoxin system
MRTRVKVESQMESFVKSLAPEPRRRLTQAIKGLAEHRGDIKRLEGKLRDYSRLRVAGHRVIFNERAERGERIIDCIFAEKRALVYELFVQMLSESPGG